MFRKWFIVVFLLMLTPMITVQARDILANDVCTIDESMTIQGTVFAFCEELYIDGTVNGDVFAATIRTEINGTVHGSVYIISGQLDVSGEIIKGIHFGGAVLRVHPLDPLAELSDDTVEPPPPRANLTIGSIKALTLSTTVYSDTIIEDGILNAGYQLIVNGDTHNEINFWGSALVINGRVDGSTFAVVGDPASDSSQIETLLLPLNLDLSLVNPGLIVGETAEITGLLSYQGPVEGDIQGKLTLLPDYNLPDTSVVVGIDEPGFLTTYFEALGSQFSTLLIIGILVLFFANNFLKAPVANLRTRPFASLAVGLLGFLLSFPVVLIIIVLSLALLGFLFILGFRGVVLAIALVLGLVNIGGVSIFYFVAIFVTRAIVGLAIGRFILRIGFGRNDVDDHRWLQYLALLLGVLLIAILTSLPIIGIIINATTLFLGLGAVMIVVTAQFERLRTVVVPTADSWYTPSPAIIREHRLRPNMEQATFAANEGLPLAPPPNNQLDTKQTPPGTQNLPEGFEWDFFED
ncbi:MAG: polymer-forming cytoskeletal protein [Phototrophicaceae bacterium]